MISCHCLMQNQGGVKVVQQILTSLVNHSHGGWNEVRHQTTQPWCSHAPQRDLLAKQIEEGFTTEDTEKHRR